MNRREAGERATLTERFQRDLVIVSCAVSAGLHAGLVPEHLAESRALGGSFALATVLLAAVAAALSRRPGSSAVLAAAGALFAGLIASYALAVTVGLPFLHPDPEPVESVAVLTKTVETVGLLAAVGLLRASHLANPQVKGELT